MKNITILIVSLILVGCSSTSMRKSVTYSSLAGCTAGAAGGYSLSPDGRKNKRANAALFCGIGAAIAGVAGYFLHKDNPSNRELKRAKNLEEVKKSSPSYSVQGTGSNISVTPQYSTIGVAEIERTDIPESIRGRLPRSRVIVKEVQEQRIKKDGEFLLIEPHRAYIYSSEIEE